MLPFKTFLTLHVHCGTLSGEGGVSKKHFKHLLDKFTAFLSKSSYLFGYWVNSNNLLLS